MALHGHVARLARAATDVEIVAAADPRPEGREALLERLPRLRWYDTAEELLARETLDFVDICAPPAMHARLIGEALERGSTSSARSRSSSRPRSCAPCPRWLAERTASSPRSTTGATRPSSRSASGSCAGSARRGPLLPLGDAARQARRGGRRHGASNWRVDPAVSGGGILMDHGWHALYVVCGWLPQAPRARARPPLDAPAPRVADRGHGRSLPRVRRRRPRRDLPDLGADERRNRVEIEGTRGAIRLDGNILDARHDAAAGHRRCDGSFPVRSPTARTIPTGSPASWPRSFSSRSAADPARGRTLEEATALPRA